MKRNEAEVVLKENSKVIFEYLEKFLMDEDKIYGTMDFYSENSKLVVHIVITQGERKVFETGFNMGVSHVYADILTKEISTYLLNEYMPSENFGVGEYASIKGMPPLNRDGIYVFNSHDSEVMINFRAQGDEFSDIMSNHNARILEYRKSKGSYTK